MASPYLGEVRVFSFNFPPKGWALCNGQLMSIQQNQALFSVLGTTYGGNGVQNFALPNLQGRTPLGPGGQQSTVLGQPGGESNHTLLTSEMAAHQHSVNCNIGTATTGSPAGAVWANGGQNNYTQTVPTGAMAPATITNAGGSLPHENTPPYLVLSFCIALDGIFPSRN